MSGPPLSTEASDAVEKQLSPDHPAPAAAARAGSSWTAPLRRAAKRALRPVITRFVQPRIAREVDAAFTGVRTSFLELREQQKERLAALEVNQELMKSEIRNALLAFDDLRALLERVAQSIAPTAGVDGIADRFAELRERVNAVERRTRQGSAVVDAEATGPPSPIDYVGFERRFRGDPAKVLATTRDRYIDILRDHGPVLDVGCGKGELIEALRDAGIEASGVDPDSGMVAEARAKGLDVHLGDANTHLAAQPEHTWGAIISTQVVEHLPIDYLVRFLELSASRLRPGGVFIAETPNPAALIVLATSFILDPTHIRPLHPGLLVFLCESAGFSSVELKFFDPATQFHLPLVAEDESTPDVVRQVNAGFRRVNDVVFGAQDYAVVARTRG